MKNLRVLAIFVAFASLGASGGYAQMNKETPEGAGFGPASLRVMRNARLPEVEPATGERTFHVVFQFTLG